MVRSFGPQPQKTSKLTSEAGVMADDSEAATYFPQFLALQRGGIAGKVQVIAIRTEPQHALIRQTS